MTSKEKVANMNLARKIINNKTDIDYTNECMTGDYLSDLILIAGEGENFRSLLTAYNRGRKLQENYDIDTYFPRHQNRMYSVDVKMRKWAKDIGDIVDDMNLKKNEGDYHLDKPITDLQKEWLESKFDDYECGESFWFWIEMEREYLCECIKEDWGKSNISFEDMGFYGNSGGHFCLCEEFPSEHLDLEYMMPQALTEFFDDGEIDNDRLVNCIDDTFEEQDIYAKNIKVVHEILTFVDKFVKGMDINEEIAFRIGEAMSDLSEFEEWKKEKEAA